MPGLHTGIASQAAEMALRAVVWSAKALRHVVLAVLQQSCAETRVLRPLARRVRSGERRIVEVSERWVWESMRRALEAGVCVVEVDR